MAGPSSPKRTYEIKSVSSILVGNPTQSTSIEVDETRSPLSSSRRRRTRPRLNYNNLHNRDEEPQDKNTNSNSKSDNESVSSSSPSHSGSSPISSTQQPQEQVQDVQAENEDEGETAEQDGGQEYSTVSSKDMYIESSSKRRDEYAKQGGRSRLLSREQENDKVEPQKKTKTTEAAAKEEKKPKQQQKGLTQEQLEKRRREHLERRERAKRESLAHNNPLFQGGSSSTSSEGAFLRPGQVPPTLSLSSALPNDDNDNTRNQRPRKPSHVTRGLHKLLQELDGEEDATATTENSSSMAAGTNSSGMVLLKPNPSSASQSPIQRAEHCMDTIFFPATLSHNTTADTPPTNLCCPKPPQLPSRKNLRKLKLRVRVDPPSPHSRTLTNNEDPKEQQQSDHDDRMDGLEDECRALPQHEEQLRNELQFLTVETAVQPSPSPLAMPSTARRWWRKSPQSQNQESSPSSLQVSPRKSFWGRHRPLSPRHRRVGQQSSFKRSFWQRISQIPTTSPKHQTQEEDENNNEPESPPPNVPHESSPRSSKGLFWKNRKNRSPSPNPKRNQRRSPSPPQTASPRSKSKHGGNILQRLNWARQQHRRDETVEPQPPMQTITVIEWYQPDDGTVVFHVDDHPDQYARKPKPMVTPNSRNKNGSDDNRSDASPWVLLESVTNSSENGNPQEKRRSSSPRKHQVQTTDTVTDDPASDMATANEDGLPNQQGPPQQPRSNRNSHKSVHEKDIVNLVEDSQTTSFQTRSHNHFSGSSSSQRGLLTDPNNGSTVVGELTTTSDISLFIQKQQKARMEKKQTEKHQQLSPSKTKWGQDSNASIPQSANNMKTPTTQGVSPRNSGNGKHKKTRRTRKGKDDDEVEIIFVEENFQSPTNISREGDQQGLVFDWLEHAHKGVVDVPQSSEPEEAISLLSMEDSHRKKAKEEIISLLSVDEEALKQEYKTLTTGQQKLQSSRNVLVPKESLYSSPPPQLPTLDSLRSSQKDDRNQPGQKNVSQPAMSSTIRAQTFPQNQRPKRHDSKTRWAQNQKQTERHAQDHPNFAFWATRRRQEKLAAKTKSRMHRNQSAPVSAAQSHHPKDGMEITIPHKRGDTEDLEIISLISMDEYTILNDVPKPENPSARKDQKDETTLVQNKHVGSVKPKRQEIAQDEMFYVVDAEKEAQEILKQKQVEKWMGEKPKKRHLRENPMIQNLKWDNLEQNSDPLRSNQALHIDPGGEISPVSQRKSKGKDPLPAFRERNRPDPVDDASSLGGKSHGPDPPGSVLQENRKLENRSSIASDETQPQVFTFDEPPVQDPDGNLEAPQKPDLLRRDVNPSSQAKKSIGVAPKKRQSALSPNRRSRRNSGSLLLTRQTDPPLTSHCQEPHARLAFGNCSQESTKENPRNSEIRGAPPLFIRIDPSPKAKACKSLIPFSKLSSDALESEPKNDRLLSKGSLLLKLTKSERTPKSEAVIPASGSTKSRNPNPPTPNPKRAQPGPLVQELKQDPSAELATYAERSKQTTASQPPRLINTDQTSREGNAVHDEAATLLQTPEPQTRQATNELSSDPVLYPAADSPDSRNLTSERSSSRLSPVSSSDATGPSPLAAHSFKSKLFRTFLEETVVSSDSSSESHETPGEASERAPAQLCRSEGFEANPADSSPKTETETAEQSEKAPEDPLLPRELRRDESPLDVASGAEEKPGPVLLPKTPSLLVASDPEEKEERTAIPNNTESSNLTPHRHRDYQNEGNTSNAEDIVENETEVSSEADRNESQVVQTSFEEKLVVSKILAGLEKFGFAKKESVKDQSEESSSISDSNHEQSNGAASNDKCSAPPIHSEERTVDESEKDISDNGSQGLVIGHSESESQRYRRETPMNFAFGRKDAIAGSISSGSFSASSQNGSKDEMDEHKDEHYMTMTETTKDTNQKSTGTEEDPIKIGSTDEKDSEMTQSMVEKPRSALGKKATALKLDASSSSSSASESLPPKVKSTIAHVKHNASIDNDSRSTLTFNIPVEALNAGGDDVIKKTVTFSLDQEEDQAFVHRPHSPTNLVQSPTGILRDTEAEKPAINDHDSSTQGMLQMKKITESIESNSEGTNDTTSQTPPVVQSLDLSNCDTVESGLLLIAEIPIQESAEHTMEAPSGSNDTSADRTNSQQHTKPDQNTQNESEEEVSSSTSRNLDCDSEETTDLETKPSQQDASSLSRTSSVLARARRALGRDDSIDKVIDESRQTESSNATNSDRAETQESRASASEDNSSLLHRSESSDSRSQIAVLDRRIQRIMRKARTAARRDSASTLTFKISDIDGTETLENSYLELPSSSSSETKHDARTPVNMTIAFESESQMGRSFSHSTLTYPMEQQERTAQDDKKYAILSPPQPQRISRSEADQTPRRSNSSTLLRLDSKESIESRRQLQQAQKHLHASVARFDDESTMTKINEPFASDLASVPQKIFQDQRSSIFRGHSQPASDQSLSTPFGTEANRRAVPSAYTSGCKQARTRPTISRAASNKEKRARSSGDHHPERRTVSWEAAPIDSVRAPCPSSSDPASLLWAATSNPNDGSLKEDRINSGHGEEGGDRVRNQMI